MTNDEDTGSDIHDAPTIPAPPPELSRLVTQAIRPDRAEKCEPVSGVRYCYYPAFAPQVPPTHALYA